jgi:diguanylate cyclase (GGDEF)-like protein/PAS domain S-box-containing protein
MIIIYSYLLSLFLHVTPIAMLFYLAVNIFLRGNTPLNRLTSALFLFLSLFFAGSFLSLILPKHFMLTTLVWLKFLPAFCIMCIFLHFTIIITKRFDYWSLRRILLISYSPTLCFLLLLIPSKSIYVDLVAKGPWSYVLPSPAIFFILIIPAASVLISCTYFLISGLRYVKQMGLTQKSMQLKRIIQSTCIGGFISLFMSFFNHYLVLWDNISYPEPSALGIIYFAIAIRYVMSKYEFLPSIERKYKFLFEKSPSAILLIDNQGRVIESNPAAQELFHISSSELVNLNCDQLFKPYLGQSKTQGKIDNLKVTLRSDLEERIVRIEKEIIDTGDDYYEYVLMRDITDSIAADEHITYLAYHDALTGLGNRRKYQETLIELLLKNDNEQETLAVILLDLDRFKQINDTQGHHVGDLLLQYVAYMLKERASSAQLIARLGGDEFVILLSGVREHDEITELCDSIMDSFKKPFFHDGLSYPITSSMGICIANNETNPDQLLQHADLAMYNAKRNGRNQYSFFINKLKSVQERRHSMEMRMRDALHEERLELYYQPQISLVTGELWGLEALVRWKDEDGTMIMPGEFIPLAEETGLIVPMGNWVLRQACTQATNWTRQGMPEIKIAVNVSNYELANHHWFERVKETLELTGFPAHLLHLEITESTTSSKEPYIQQVYEDLLNLGISLAIDDFGTGYSTFSSMQAIRFQIFKIDQSIIHNLTENSNTREIVKAMIAMAHSLQQIVVAEGVETEEQALTLKSLACDVVQGYYYSAPVPETELLARYPGFSYTAK